MHVCDVLMHNACCAWITCIHLEQRVWQTSCDLIRRAVQRTAAVFVSLNSCKTSCRVFCLGWALISSRVRTVCMSSCMIQDDGIPFKNQEQVLKHMHTHTLTLHTHYMYEVLNDLNSPTNSTAQHGTLSKPHIACDVRLKHAIWCEMDGRYVIWYAFLRNTHEIAKLTGKKYPLCELDFAHISTKHANPAYILEKNTPYGHRFWIGFGIKLTNLSQIHIFRWSDGLVCNL